MIQLSPLAWLALGSATFAAVILIACLVLRPKVGPALMAWLFLGLGALPISAAVSGNIQNYETTKKRSFCASCHVMGPWTIDAADPTSHSLAARHSRNALFGDESCYVCHADYGMFGTVTTKLGGMRHVWEYYTRYRTVPTAEAIPTIHLYEPYRNQNCMQCHSTSNQLWREVPDHKASLEDVQRGTLSCASAGCHGFAHPASHRKGDKT
jgi:cytochrome c-type protein NapC